MSDAAASGAPEGRRTRVGARGRVFQGVSDDRRQVELEMASVVAQARSNDAKQAVLEVSTPNPNTPAVAGAGITARRKNAMALSSVKREEKYEAELLEAHQGRQESQQQRGCCRSAVVWCCSPDDDDDIPEPVLPEERSCCAAFFVEASCGLFSETFGAACRSIVVTRLFRYAIVMAIMVNSVVLAVELDYGDSDSAIWDVFAQLFTWLFLAEAVIKILGFGIIGYFQVGWNVFDFFLVVSTTLALAIDPGQVNASLAMSLRLMRLLRVGRLLRTAQLFDELDAILSGFLQSLKSLFWAGVAVLMCIFIAAVWLTEVVGKSSQFPSVANDPNGPYNAIRAYYDTVPRSMFSLFQIMTFESWSTVAVRPVMEKMPWTLLIFIPFILITAFTFMNIVVAILTDQLLRVRDERAKTRLSKRAAAIETQKEEVTRALAEMDTDGNDRISAHEIQMRLDRYEEAREKMAKAAEKGISSGTSSRSLTSARLRRNGSSLSGAQLAERRELEAAHQSTSDMLALLRGLNIQVPDMLDLTYIIANASMPVFSTLLGSLGDKKSVLVADRLAQVRSAQLTAEAEAELADALARAQEASDGSSPSNQASPGTKGQPLASAGSPEPGASAPAGGSAVVVVVPGDGDDKPEEEEEEGDEDSDNDAEDGLATEQAKMEQLYDKLALAQFAGLHRELPYPALVNGILGLRGEPTKKDIMMLSAQIGEGITDLGESVAQAEASSLQQGQAQQAELQERIEQLEANQQRMMGLLEAMARKMGVEAAVPAEGEAPEPEPAPTSTAAAASQAEGLPPPPPSLGRLQSAPPPPVRRRRSRVSGRLGGSSAGDSFMTRLDGLRASGPPRAGGVMHSHGTRRRPLADVIRRAMAQADEQLQQTPRSRARSRRRSSRMVIQSMQADLERDAQREASGPLVLSGTGRD